MGRYRMAALAIVSLLVIPQLVRLLGWRAGYLLQVYSIIPIWVVGCLSLTVITGYVGEISVAQAALAGLAAYTSAILCTNGWALPVALGAGMLASATGAVILGLPTLRLRGPYFVVTSMAFNGIFYGVAVHWLDVTRGPNGISGFPAYGSIPALAWYLPWFVALLCLICVAWLAETRFGKSMMAVRDDDLAASAIGLRVAWIKVVAFLFSGILAGVSGVLMSHQIGYVTPELYTIDQSVFLLTTVLLGGVRRIEGAVLGSVLLVLMQELLRSFPYVQLLFMGITMLVVVLFFPNGLVSLLTARRRAEA